MARQPAGGQPAQEQGLQAAGSLQAPAQQSAPQQATEWLPFSQACASSMAAEGEPSVSAQLSAIQISPTSFLVFATAMCITLLMLRVWSICCSQSKQDCCIPHAANSA